MAAKISNERRFENFIILDLNKGPVGSCGWLARVVNDKTLSYEQSGMLLMLGETLIGSSFGFEQVFNLRSGGDTRSMVNSIKGLIQKDYIALSYCKNMDDYSDYIERLISKHIPLST